MKNPQSVVIVDAIRTPIGRYGGVFKDVRPDDLMAQVLTGLMARHPEINPAELEDVLVGCANQAGEDNRNVARMSVLLSGLPISVAGGTVNRLCGSGLMAVNQASHALAFGDGEMIIAGGVESMTRAPLVMAKPDQEFPRGDMKLFDTTLGWRFTNPTLAKLYHPYTMGETAENVAEQYQISRADQDEFAYQSQQKTDRAVRAGRFEREILPISVPQGKKPPILISQDESPRPETTLEKLSTLKPVFREGGSVTAGNASTLNDGAAALLMMTEEKALALGLKPLVRVLHTAVAGVDPATMGIGPVPAIQKLLIRSGLTLDQIDLIELNEAFAAQSLACIRQLQLDPTKVNVNGGAIALGHPLGCSGARLMTTLAYELQQCPHARYGIAALCIGVGQGIATLVEKY